MKKDQTEVVKTIEKSGGKLNKPWKQTEVVIPLLWFIIKEVSIIFYGGFKGSIGVGLRRKISAFDSQWYLTTLDFFTRIKNDDIFLFCLYLSRFEGTVSLVSCDPPDKDG